MAVQAFDCVVKVAKCKICILSLFDCHKITRLLLPNKFLLEYNGSKRCIGLLACEYVKIPEIKACEEVK
jgi:hypothetical protein